MYNVISMKDVAKRLNDLTYSDFYYRLMLIARSVYEWHNLPNGIDEKWIEKYLYYEGNCMFFKDKDKGFMVAKCKPSGTLNYYDEPTLLTPYGTNYVYDGEGLENNDEAILIRNNDEMIPTDPSIELFALRLADITRSLDVNVRQQKTPSIVLCSDKQKLTMKNVLKQRDENEITIYGDKNLDISEIKVLKIDAPIVFPQLQIQKHNIWNEAMTFLGINNANMDKRERLVADEVSANNSQIEASANIFLKSRERACELINEKFGLNISVTRRTEIEPIVAVSGGVEND